MMPNISTTGNSYEAGITEEVIRTTITKEKGCEAISVSASSSSLPSSSSPSLRKAGHLEKIYPRSNTMVQSRLHYIPLVLFIFFPSSFFICYIIALELDHINAFFQFISDAGTLPPEQHVFAQLVNIGAALFAYFIYIRYVQVDSFMKERYHQTTPIANVIALAFGFTSSLGMSLVGNFPELQEKEVHLLGAFLTFVSGSIYTVFQGYLTFKMLPFFQSKAVAYIRTFLGILGLMLYFGAQTTIILAYQQSTNKEKLENSPKALKWKDGDGGFGIRAASVIMEWLLVIIFDVFIATFISEFKKFKLEAPHVKFSEDIQTDSVTNPISIDGSLLDGSASGLEATLGDILGGMGDIPSSETGSVQLAPIPLDAPFVIFSDGQPNHPPQGGYLQQIPMSVPPSHNQMAIMFSESKLNKTR